MDLYASEVDRLQLCYAERQAVLAKVRVWEELWHEKIQHEAAQNNPKRYINRGGNLEKELKVTSLFSEYVYEEQCRICFCIYACSESVS